MLTDYPTPGPMSRLLILSLALTLAACDSGSAPPVLESGFQATVTGAFERSLAGDAATTDLAGTGVSVPINPDGTDELTVLLFDAAEADDAFVFIGLTETALAPGVYDVNGLESFNADRPAGLADGFTIAYRYPVEGGRFRTEGVSFSEGGTVTIRQATDATIAGDFAFTVTTVVDGETPGTAPVSIEGSFVADVRTREGGGSR